MYRVRKSGDKYTCARIIFAVLCLAVILLSVYRFILAVKTMSFTEYYGTDEILLVNPDEKTEVEPTDIKYEDGEIYLPFELVSEYIDENIYRSEDKDRIIITTGDRVIRMRSEQNEAYVNGNPIELNMPVYDTDSLPVSVLEGFYPVKLSYSEENNTVTLMHTDKEYTTAVIGKNTSLKYEPTFLSTRARKLSKGEKVTVFESEDRYIFVTTSDGLCGYVTDDVLSDYAKTEAETEAPEPKQLWKCEDGMANIVFDQISNSTANTDAERMPLYDGVDVVCPTWFSFENTNGDIRNIADKSYVERAHANNIKVWGLITDNFDSDISHAVLSDADVREKVIKQILAYSSLYDLDGINIDFEAVPNTDGDLYVQFIRELAPMLHNEGITLSADFFVPKAWTYHYNRGKCAEVLDYVIVMGYDQHYAGSDTAGSNAEIGWSKEAITATLACAVPKDKLILGIPFYTRVWTINNSTGELSQKAMGMQAAKEFMSEKGGNETWLEEAGQNYSEATDGEYTYKCWFEDSDSIKLRLELAKQYGIAGVAAWKNGLETEDIWSILKDELKN
jgi:spore germination protein YaaH